MAAGLGTTALLALALTNAPTIWARRDPMSDPERQVSAALGHLSNREDLIVLQAGSAEHYLPFYYDRINIMSTRELWYLYGGAGHRTAAAGAITNRIWHALAKGSSVWIEKRVLEPGQQISDHYVFSEQEVQTLLRPYGDTVQPEQVRAGPEVFYRLSPQRVFATHPEWDFVEDQAGWSGVNIAGERVGREGWCFGAGEDPNLYGPPLKLQAQEYALLEIVMASDVAGRAQLFYRADPTTPYSEERSLPFDVLPGVQQYKIDLRHAPGWEGELRGLRLDPVEGADAAGGTAHDVCVRSIRLLTPRS